MTDKLEHEGTIYAVLKKYGLYNKLDEYIDICWIGYAKALLKFDPSKGKLRTFIYRCVENELLNELRKESAKKRGFKTTEITDTNIIDEDINIECEAMVNSDNKELYERLFSLPPYEQYVLYQMFFKNRSQQDIANHLGFTQTKVSNLKKRGLKLLRKEYADEDIN